MQPQPSAPENQDVGRPLLQRQHLTDDWWGWRPWLDDRGLAFDATLTLDVSRSFRGGVSTSRTIARHLLDLNMTVDTERLWGWHGATVFLDFQSFNGSTGDRIVGDFQIFSNIDALPVTQLPQMWIEQRLWDGTVRIKVGKVDANTEFAYTEHGAEFLNSFMGFSPTIFVMPTYPDPATSVNVFWEPSSAVYLGISVYDGSGQRGVPTGSRGLRSLLGEKLFTIGELGLRWWRDDLPGRLAAGAWHHNGNFQTFSSHTESGTAGWYVVLDQEVIRWISEEGAECGVGVFLQYGAADPDVSEVTRHVGAGMAWRGPIPQRKSDTPGAGITWVRFSRQFGRAFTTETATEVFYRLALTRWAELTFNLQYIAHPGGVANRRDALVGTTRLMIRF